MKSARSLHLSEEEIELLGDTQLISLKPVIYVANVAEDQINKPLESNPYYQALKEYADAEHAYYDEALAQQALELGKVSPSVHKSKANFRPWRTMKRLCSWKNSA